ncbi:hypothetical protein [Planococcus faecalis]|uniref:Uncharacterized protein n=1 Tax=Planococcus faecalis TaxID=1598147 RepID=A0ABM6IT51_9BACL|nr:hypothetical protein [Planococcus faecalis]AQU79758.1 hypothetical protein AJGP001_10985 [Planococcus faecalis]OHX52048.1 hypothetical protein BB777_14035 [Planococcus faecalis]
MRKVEDLQEYRDTQNLKERMKRLPAVYQSILAGNIVDEVCWRGPVTREFLEAELDSFEGAEKEWLVKQKQV